MKDELLKIELPVVELPIKSAELQNMEFAELIYVKDTPNSVPILAVDLLQVKSLG